MTINWEKSAVVLIDIALVVYLALSITVLNHPDEEHSVCNEVKIDIKEGAVQGFLNPDEIKAQLPTEMVAARQRLADLLNTKVQLTCSANGKGKISIPFADSKELARIMKAIGLKWKMRDEK